MKGLFKKKKTKPNKRDQSLWFWTAQIENNQSLLPKRPLTPPRDYVPGERLASPTVDQNPLILMLPS